MTNHPLTLDSSPVINGGTRFAAPIIPTLQPTCTPLSSPHPLPRSCPVSNPFTHSQWPRLSDILNENDPFGKAGFLGAERKPSKVNHQNHVLGYHLKTWTVQSAHQSARPPARPSTSVASASPAPVGPPPSTHFRLCGWGGKKEEGGGGRRCTDHLSLARRCNCDVRRPQFKEQFVLLLSLLSSEGGGREI